MTAGKPVAYGGTPGAAVTAEWGPCWAADDVVHLSIVVDEWRTSSPCHGCPECRPALVAAAAAAGWTWRQAATWGETTCDGCDTFVCEQPRHGVWVDRAGRQVCGYCVRMAIAPKVDGAPPR